MTRVRSERGATAVEFALVLPVLLLLLLGIVEFGRVYNAQMQLTAAARDGARVMSINSVPSQAAADAKAATIASAIALHPDIATDQISISISPSSTATCVPGSVATVAVSYPMQFLSGMFGATINLTGKGVMQCSA
ncbi:TadE/TadG family type IV pilus assembly protein [Arthrobacter crystallopoietes]|uniref:TadE/TadG family type IV pilus assembly protein n=1 Tax=Crystallibacter crystallopoietes TaxID=37928 RepID=UPI0011114008|nr:TadE family protein [Arthrobacter crystallopoietes]